MAAVSLLRGSNMAAVTLCENRELRCKLTNQNYRQLHVTRSKGGEMHMCRPRLLLVVAFHCSLKKWREICNMANH